MHDECANHNFLRNNIGHNLQKALDAAETRGFVSEAPNLKEITKLLSDPYAQHHFRYERPEQMPLPDIKQVIEMFASLDSEFEVALGLNG